MFAELWRTGDYPHQLQHGFGGEPGGQHFFACLSPEDKAGFINVVASAPDEETMTQQLARPSTFCKMKTGTTTAYNPLIRRPFVPPVLFQPRFTNPIRLCYDTIVLKFKLFLEGG